MISDFCSIYQVFLGIRGKPIVETVCKIVNIIEKLNKQLPINQKRNEIIEELPSIELTGRASNQRDRTVSGNH